MAQSARDAALRLSWRRCGGDGHWCSFFDFSLDSDSLAKGGAYVIWAEDADGSRKKDADVVARRPSTSVRGNPLPTASPGIVKRA